MGGGDYSFKCDSTYPFTKAYDIIIGSMSWTGVMDHSCIYSVYSYTFDGK